jgi:hypothetical protein
MPGASDARLCNIRTIRKSRRRTPNGLTPILQHYANGSTGVGLWLDTRLTKELTEQFTKPATEPHDIDLLQEARSWLRSLPESERLSRAQKLAADGDKTALRALLTAPAYLTGIDEAFWR